jgi:ATP-dependent RNA helicase DeaD
MVAPDFGSILGPALAGALEKKGFQRLTPVQEAVLDDSLRGRDLRITSQTGSGKTVAIGFALRHLIEGMPRKPGGAARPRAIVVAPTRELAKQVEQELTWLYSPLHARVASTTGGASYHEERRALAGGPAVVVGTPGRLLDHLQRGAIDPTEVSAVVLDEADRMLDLGFREDLEAILGFAPPGHRTHLISATFPHGVRALADRVQVDPAHVQGTPLGAANVDIDHVVHLVDPHDRFGAVINLLLAHPDEQTLIFARTRADVARLAKDLQHEGFGVSSLSGEMEQAARNRALGDFKRGKLRVLVATDVAARGIDVQDIARVIHVDPPDDADSYTHRSGRTGRAGRKGQSSVLVSPSGLTRTAALLKRARVSFRIHPVPSADDIRRSADDRTYQALTADDPEGFAGYDQRLWSLAKRLASGENVSRTIARLLDRANLTGPTHPREIRAFAPPSEKTHERPAAPASRSEARNGGTFVPFRVSWGGEQGADARRVLAMVCRRGGIHGADVGNIRIARGFSIVEVASAVADAFAEASEQPDPRNPRVRIKRDTKPPAHDARPQHQRPRKGSTRRRSP